MKNRYVRGDVSNHAPEASIPMAGMRRGPARRDETRHSALPPLRRPVSGDYSSSDFALAEQMFRRLQRGDTIRIDKVARVRTALASGGYEGAYDTELAFEIVAERLLEDLMP